MSQADRRAARVAGVVRVSDLTRLDRVGLPVVVAVRAGVVGESNTVSTGKGRSLTEARLRAVMEAYERWAAEPRGRIPIWRGPAPSTPHVPLAALVPTTGAAIPAVLDWCGGHDVETGESVAVPASAVFFPWLDDLCFAPSTTGLAAGETRADAVERGLLECIERDTVSRALARLARAAPVPATMLLHTHLSPPYRRMAGRAERHGLKVRLCALDEGQGVPVVQAVVEEALATLRWTHAGWAARRSVEAAADAAFAEAVQSRLTDIQGAREDLDAAHPEPHPFFTTDAPEGPPPVPWARTLVEAGRRTGLGRAAYVDLRTDDRLPAAVRVVWEGLEHWAFDPDRAGPRLDAT